MSNKEALSKLYERLAASCELAEEEGMSKAELIGALEVWKVTAMYTMIQNAETEMDQSPS